MTTPKTPQQIRNEVEKEIEKCKEGIMNNIAEGYSYDGWNIELKKAEAQLQILTEYDKSIKEMIKNIKEEVENLEYAEYNVTETRISALMRIYKMFDNILSKIGDNSEVKE